MWKRLFLAAAAACLICAVPVYADEETEAEIEAESRAEEELTDEEQMIQDYLEYVHGLEASELTPEEEEAGYQIINGQKYAPEELAGDSSSEDVIFGGVQGTSLTGTLTVAAIVPEYVHEEVYVHLTNMNTYKIYGIRLFEANGYSAQMNVPSGVYLVSAGGLTADTAARFYVNGSQFLVKRGSIQTLLVTVVDSEPERAEEAYREEETEEDLFGEIWEATPSDAGDEEESNPPTEAETRAQEEQAEEGEEEPDKQDHPWLRTLLFTLLFSGVPLGCLLAYVIYRQKKKLD